LGPETRTFADLLIDCEEDLVLRAYCVYVHGPTPSRALSPRVTPSAAMSARATLLELVEAE
jgi:hypothetical protein